MNKVVQWNEILGINFKQNESMQGVELQNRMALKNCDGHSGILTQHFE